MLTDIRQDGTSITLRWTSVPNRRYRVVFKSALDESIWSNLTGELTAGSTSSTATDQLTSTGRRFYRVMLLP